MTYDHNQTLVPDAFLALHSAHGRPILSRSETEARHAACEDTALQTATFLSETGVDPSDADPVLRRVYAGLAQVDDRSDGEAEWVVRRVAELLDWPQPAVLVAD